MVEQLAFNQLAVGSSPSVPILILNILINPLGGMVDTADLKSAGISHAGSSPVVGIIKF